jgi:hypothetical protein
MSIFYKILVNGWYEEFVLNEQNYVIIDHEAAEAKQTVGKLVSQKGKKLGLKDLRIREFKLYV